LVLVQLRIAGLSAYLKGVKPWSNRIDVKKTYKLYINGAFPHAHESGRTYEVKSCQGCFCR